jgi:acyl dehydratase
MTAALAPGQMLDEMAFEPHSRTRLALFAGASGDHNPIHIDIDFARAAGMPDVFGHGMLSMAYAGRYLTHIAPLERLRSWGMRFTAIAPVDARITCYGEVISLDPVGTETHALIKLGARLADGTVILDGTATIAA